MADNLANANTDVEADEATDDVDIDLENDTTAWETEEDNESEESGDESDAEESDDSDEDADEEAESEEADADDDEEAQDDDTSKENEAQSEEDTKARNREMAQRRLAAKAEREAQLKAAQQEFIADAEDDRDAALRQLQVDAYESRVARNESKVSSEYERAIRDFPILSNNDPVIQEVVNKAIDSFQAMHVRIDDFGNAVEVRGNLYDFLQDQAASIERLTGLGAKTQEKSKAKEKSKAAIVPGRAPKKGKVDPDLAAFDEVANR